jgi:biopolymer transport protein ExbD
MSTNKKIPSVPPPLAPRPLRLRADSLLIDTTSETARVELVPMIDVIFCILIFFILAAVSLSRQQAISVDLPTATTGTPQGRQILMVSLNELGQVFVEQQPMVTKEQFLQRLQEYRKQNPDGLMALYASTNTNYSDVVQVLDLLRQVGGDRVALATLPGQPGQPGQTPNLSPSLPPGTGVPGLTPYPSPPTADPYGNLNPTNPLNPSQPQLTPYPGLPLPGSPGLSPGIPQPLPGQTPISPNNSAVPSPGATTSPRTNLTPGNPAVPSPGATTSPRTNLAPGNPAVPSPGTTTSPRTNAAPDS